MNTDTEHLRAQLFLVLSRLKKKAAYWTAPLTVRMNDKAGTLLYEILEKENGNWVRDKERYRLNGCNCTMTEASAGGSTTYLRFYLCRAHAKELFQVPNSAKIESERPAVKMHTPKAPTAHDHKGHRGGMVRNNDPGETMFGWHDGVNVISGGLIELGKGR